MIYLLNEMDVLNRILIFIFDLLFFPITVFNPMAGLIFISILVGILMIVVFKYSSNQEAIKKQKNYLKAHLLEFRLYKDDVGLSLAAMKNLMTVNLRYLTYVLRPMLVLMVPTAIILIQLASWYEYRPLQVGESAILSLKLKEAAALDNIELEVPMGLAVATPSLRIFQKNEVDWRIRAVNNGVWEIKFRNGVEVLSKSLRVADSFEKLSAYRIAGNSPAVLLYPTETALPADSFIQEIHVDYPHRQLSFWGWQVHWLVVFLVVSIAAGYLMKGFFNVQV